MTFQSSNYGMSTLASAIGASDVTLAVVSGAGALYSSTGPFMVQLGAVSGAHELVRCVSRVGDTLNIVRSQESTSAQPWPAGTPVQQVTTAAQITALGGYSYVYAPAGWDAAWLAAKANSASAPAVVAGIGDSVTAGQGSSDAGTKAWFPLVRQYLLNQGLTLGGDYYDTKYASGLGGPTMASYPLVQHGVVTTDYVLTNSIFNQFTRNTATVVAPWLTFTSPYAVTGFDIIYLDYATATPGWTYNIDGGANTNVNTTGPSTNAGAIVKKISITGLSSAVHTLNINTTGTASACVIAGIAAYASTSAGVRFANHGWPGQGLIATGGASTNTLSDTTLFPPDRLGLHQGYQGTSAAPTSLRGLGFPTQPDLAIVAFGINDAIGAGNATTFRDALRRLCQVLRYGKSDACSILICGMYWGDGSTVGGTSVNSSDWTGTQYPGLQDLYEAMRKVALEYNCAYVSAHTMLGRTPATNGWTTSATDGHPNDTGHSKIAALIEQVL